MQIAQIRDWATALAEIVLAQRTEASQKAREKIAANYRKRRAEKSLEDFETRVAALKEFSKLPRYSQRKAWRVKFVLNAHHFCIDRKGLIPAESNRVACSLWLLMRGESINERTIRRWLARERAGGGREFAPIKCYADRKSVPHPRASKAALKAA